MSNDLANLMSSLVVDGVVKPVSEDAIQRCEERLGIALPASYKDYCRIFGAGELFRLFWIYVPKAKHERYDLETKHLFWRNALSPEEVEEYCDDPDLFWRAIFFADDIRNDYYAWDVTDVTNAKDNEYAIYRVRRDFTLDRLANTFAELIFQTCVGRAHRLAEENDEEAEMIFRSFN